MDSLEAKLFAASLRTDLPEIDLHGLHTAEALEKLDVFLYTIYTAHESAGRVITGIGKGVLQAAVENYLREHSLVGALEGGAGVVVVVLK